MGSDGYKDFVLEAKEETGVNVSPPFSINTQGLHGAVALGLEYPDANLTCHLRGHYRLLTSEPGFSPLYTRDGNHRCGMLLSCGQVLLQVPKGCEPFHYYCSF
jgi:hypothetical protein